MAQQLPHASVPALPAGVEGIAAPESVAGPRKAAVLMAALSNT